MENQPTPYIDPGYNLWSYANRVLCHCPKCDRQAIVAESRIYCLSCTYQERKSAVNCMVMFWVLLNNGVHIVLPVDTDC